MTPEPFIASLRGLSPQTRTGLPPMTDRSRITALLSTIAVAAALASCVKPTAFNPYSAPDRAELDRLQQQINDRPDLEVVEHQLSDLDNRIRAVISTYSAATRIPPSTLMRSSACSDPFAHNIGQSTGIERLNASPAPSSGDWSEITVDLRPILTAAGFQANTPPGTTPPDGTFSFIRDDGATIDLQFRPGILLYKYATGCHLPAAWRTGPPPPEQRPLNDPNVHYPYLFESAGGRNAPAK